MESFVEILCVLDTLCQKGFNHVRLLFGWQRLASSGLWAYRWRCAVVYVRIPGDGFGETNQVDVMLMKLISATSRTDVHVDLARSRATPSVRFLDYLQ
jgi:hypothetical protein